ncbi:MAG: class I SAM-dependent RNA methyltransferase, partial [Pseudoclavibacter sp.]
VRITESKSSFSRAVALDAIETSEHRAEHVWPEAGIARDPEERAGGAELGHIELAHQRTLKAEVIVDAMQRFGGVEGGGERGGVERPGGPADRAESSDRSGADRVDLGALEVEAMPGDDDARGTGWRTRVTLHIDDDGNVGPYAARSRRVIHVASLPLATSELERIAPLDGVLPTHDKSGRDRSGSAAPTGPGRIDLVAPSEAEASLRVRLDHGPRPRRAGMIRERVLGIDFEVDEDGFWQVHRHAATALADTVLDVARDGLDPQAQHLDLYGGVGLFAAMFANAGATYVETVEAASRATGHAVRNLAPWRGPTAVTARVDRYLRDLEREVTAADRADLRAGTILLDPPRSGAGREVTDAIAAFEPAQIIYVACDPVALARDTRTLRESGYSLDALRALDLFPNTHHVECVARFVPREDA